VLLDPEINSGRHGLIGLRRVSISVITIATGSVAVEIGGLAMLDRLYTAYVILWAGINGFISLSGWRDRKGDGINDTPSDPR